MPRMFACSCVAVKLHTSAQVARASDNYISGYDGRSIQVFFYLSFMGSNRPGSGAALLNSRYPFQQWLYEWILLDFTWSVRSANSWPNVKGMWL